MLFLGKTFLRRLLLFSIIMTMAQIVFSFGTFNNCRTLCRGQGVMEGEPYGELEAQISPKQGQKVKTKSWYPTIWSKKWSIALTSSNI